MDHHVDDREIRSGFWTSAGACHGIRELEPTHGPLMIVSVSRTQKTQATWDKLDNLLRTSAVGRSHWSDPVPEGRTWSQLSFAGPYLTAQAYLPNILTAFTEAGALDRLRIRRLPSRAGGCPHPTCKIDGISTSRTGDSLSRDGFARLAAHALGPRIGLGPHGNTWTIDGTRAPGTQIIQILASYARYAAEHLPRGLPTLITRLESGHTSNYQLLRQVAGYKWYLDRGKPVARPQTNIPEPGN